MRKIVGIDLAGKEKNPSGYCLLEINDLEERVLKVLLLYSDDEIIGEIEKDNPILICVDAPLSFPSKGYFRDSDLALISLGFRPLSPMLPGMKTLAERAIKLKSILEARGYKVIEVFPRATERILNLKKERRVNKDKYDAFLCAITGKYYLKNRFEILENEIVIPSVDDEKEF
ncbi:MAG: hypothetical protein QW758_01675 [Candidatus Aenigmatarchaeota archaeon]